MVNKPDVHCPGQKCHSDVTFSEVTAAAQSPGTLYSHQNYFFGLHWKGPGKALPVQLDNERLLSSAFELKEEKPSSFTSVVGSLDHGKSQHQLAVEICAFLPRMLLCLLLPSSGDRMFQEEMSESTMCSTFVFCLKKSVLIHKE